MVTELETVKVEPYIPLGDIAKFVLRSPFTPVNNSSSMAPFLRLSDELKAKLKRARATHTRLYVPTWISETPSFETLIASYPFSIVDLVARQFRVVALNPNSAIELSDPTNLTVTDRDRLKLELGYPDLKLGDTIIARELYRGQTSSNYCDTINTMLAFDLIDLATDHGIYNPQDLDSYFQVHQAQLNGCPWGDQVRPSYRALSLGLSNLVSANSIDLLVEAGLLDPKNLEVFYEKVSGWLLAAWSRGAFEDRLPNQGVFIYSPYSFFSRKNQLPPLSFLPYISRVFELAGSYMEGKVPAGFGVYSAFSLKQSIDHFYSFVDQVIVSEIQKLLNLPYIKDLNILVERAGEAYRAGKVDLAKLQQIERIYNQIQADKEFVYAQVKYYIDHSRLLTASHIVDNSPVELEAALEYPISLDSMLSRVRSSGGRLPINRAVMDLTRGSRKEFGPN